MKKIILTVLAILSAVGTVFNPELAADDSAFIETTTTTTFNTTTPSWRYYYDRGRVNLWHGDITIEYGQSFDFVDFLPYDRYYQIEIEIWGEEETTFKTDYNGFFNNFFNSCHLVIMDVSPDHFIITNWNPEPLTILEINMFLN